MDDEYPNEAVISVPGGEIRCPAYPEGCSYVRITDDEGEVAYWTSDEWAEDPEVVMGAIIGAAMGGRIKERA